MYSFAQKCHPIQCVGDIEVSLSCILLLHEHIFNNLSEILLYNHFIIKVSSKKIIPIKQYDNLKISTPLFQRENSRYDIVQPLGTICPFDILFGSYKHNCIQSYSLCLWVERLSIEHYLITMNNERNITFYHFFLCKLSLSNKRFHVLDD